MYCRNCGSEEPEGSRFCRKCGTPFQETKGEGNGDFEVVGAASEFLKYIFLVLYAFSFLYILVTVFVTYYWFFTYITSDAFISIWALIALWVVVAFALGFIMYRWGKK